MSNQLNRVLSVLLDGQWHSLHEISQKLFIKKRSAGSRIRDLRLPTYGKHSIEVRPTSKHQIFEYRLTTQNASPNPSIGNISVGPLDLPWQMKPQEKITIRLIPGDVCAQEAVKFLNTQSMNVELHPRSQCEIRTVGGFQRLVALDDSGQTIMHYITTQDIL